MNRRAPRLDSCARRATELVHVRACEHGARRRERVQVRRLHLARRRREGEADIRAAKVVSQQEEYVRRLGIRAGEKVSQSPTSAKATIESRSW